MGVVDEVGRCAAELTAGREQIPEDLADCNDLKSHGLPPSLSHDRRRPTSSSVFLSLSIFYKTTPVPSVGSQADSPYQPPPTMALAFARYARDGSMSLPASWSFPRAQPRFDFLNQSQWQAGPVKRSPAPHRRTYGIHW